MMPPPPKVCPVSPVPVPLPALELPPDVEPPLVSVLPVGLVVGLVLPVGPVLEAGLAVVVGLLAVGLDDPKMEPPPGEEPNALPAGEAPAIPFPPLGPVPASVDPARGCPKKPIAVGVLFCPKAMAFHSSLPVVGSMYFLRR